MKKLLIASTALVATAGFAAADVTLGGSANMGIKYNSGAANTTSVHHEVDFDIKGSGTTDGGLTFGASLDVDDDNQALGTVNDSEVFISGAFGTLTVGSVDRATDGHGFADVGFDGIGIDDDAEGRRAMGSSDIHFKTTFDALTVILSASSLKTTTGSDFAIALGYDFGAFDVSIGHAIDDQLLAANDSSTSIVVNGATGDINFGIFYDTAKVAGATVNSYGVDVGYTMGATSLVFAYGDTNIAGDDADYGIGVTYDLGGGAKLGAGLGSIDRAAGARTTVADFGINFTF